MFNSRLFLALSLIVFIASHCEVNAQDFRSEVGHNELISQLGAALEDGSTLQVTQVEALSGGFYIADPTLSQMSGKSLIDVTGTNGGVSGHANTVSIRFFGNTGGLARGIDTISFFSADDWINNQTGLSTGGEPPIQLSPIQNHSWIANGIPGGPAVNVLRRVDYMIDRDNSLVVAGANNGASSDTPQVFGHGYNSITVGRTDGGHSQTDTSFNGAGRQKPEIVAPGNATSFATPIVSGAAAILYEAAAGTPAQETESLKAIMMAGATKKEFANWSRTFTRPIDDTFGFGEVNLYNSYRMLQGGETNSSPGQPSSAASLLGWDYEPAMGVNDSRFYTLVVTQPADEISIALAWDIDITDANPDPNVFSGVANLPGLDLAILDSSSSFPGTVMDFSVSPVDNFEHIYLRDVEPGTYTIQVTSANDPTEYAIAWRVSEFTDVPAANVTVVRGNLISGAAADLTASDDTRMAFTPGFTLNDTEAPVWLELDAVSTSGHPSGIRFEIEANVSTPGLEQTVEVFNEVNGAFEVVDSGPASFNVDQVISHDFNGTEMFNFLDANDSLRARLSWRQVGFIINFPWEVRIDQAGWKVAE